MRVACSACHIGQARALVPVVAALVAAGHIVRILLDANQPAFAVYKRGDLQFPGCEVVAVNTGVGGAQVFAAFTRTADKVLVMLSPTDTVMTTERLLAGVAIGERKTTLGYSEVPCGHLAPMWREILAQFDTLFVAQRTSDLQPAVNVVKVGMDIPNLDAIRAMVTKTKLEFAIDDPWVWYCGGPYHQAGDILGYIVRAVHQLRREAFPRLQIVFTRHGRDKADPKSLGSYCQAAAVAESLSVPIIENSADHEPGETTVFQRDEIIPYAQLLEACSANGVIVTGHGTDGLKAPYLRIPSILCVGSKLNPHIRNEKGCETLPLPIGCPIQITESIDLEAAIYSRFKYRDACISSCREYYPRQAKSPAQIIAEHMSIT